MSTQKRVIEVFPEIHKRVTKRAKKVGISSKQFSSYLLDYALKKEESGELMIVQRAEEPSKEGGEA